MGRNWDKERLKRTNHRKSTPAHRKLIMDRDFSFQAVLQEVITDWRYPFLLLVTNMVQPCAAKRLHLAQLLSYQATCHYLVLARTDLKKYATNDCLWLQLKSSPPGNQKQFSLDMFMIPWDTLSRKALWFLWFEPCPSQAFEAKHSKMMQHLCSAGHMSSYVP